MNQNKQAPRRRMTRREWRIRRCLRLARNWAMFLVACGAAVALMTSGILWLLPKAHALIAGPEAFVARNYDGTEYQLNLADARLVLVNGTDIWTEYGVFLVEDRRGGMENLSAILTPSKTKTDTAVNIREEDGEKYSSVLTPRNEARDVTLHFALFGKTQAGWLKKYFEFINFLKKGRDGWLEISFPQLALTLRVKYTDCSKFQPLTYLWKEGVHAGKFKVKFREPVPVI